MKCLYCDKQINKYSLYNLFIEEDELCLKCRKELNLKRRYFKLEDLNVEYFYDYNSLFKTLLLQYKECYDEALKSIFLYRIDTYLKVKYYNYKIAYVPSSTSKLNQRGFNHLKLIFEELRLKEVEGIRMKKELIQEGRDLNERKKMLVNYVYEGEKLDRVLLVDDVCTTGSSLLGVYNALKPYTKCLKALVLAKV